jgi:hypothetical protein
MSAARLRLLLAGVVAAGLAVAFWLPTRNDSASATENRRAQSQDSGWSRTRDDGSRDRDGRRDRDRQRDGNGQNNDQSPPPSEEPPTEAPTEDPTSPPTEDPTSPPTEDPTTPPTEEPPTSEPPTTPPTSEPPPTTEPPTTPPTSEAPVAEPWAPFTNYVAGEIVTFGGKDFQVQETHTSLPGWEPTNIPSLFKVL